MSKPTDAEMNAMIERMTRCMLTEMEVSAAMHADPGDTTYNQKPYIKAAVHALVSVVASTICRKGGEPRSVYEHGQRRSAEIMAIIERWNQEAVVNQK